MQQTLDITRVSGEQLQCPRYTSSHSGGHEEFYLLGYDAVWYALHGVISQKKILFKTTAVKTSNPTILLLLRVFVTAVTFLPSNDRGIFTEPLPSNDRATAR
jgi:hypothetical protein